MPVVELSIKIREEELEGEVTVPADPTVAVAALATLAHTVAESVGVSNENLLEMLSVLMEEEE